MEAAPLLIVLACIVAVPALVGPYLLLRGFWRAVRAPSIRDRGGQPKSPWLMLVAGAVLVYLQVVFGALLTHAGRIDLHLAGAVAVFVVLPMVTARLRRSGDSVAAPVAHALLVLLGLQLALGVGAYLSRFSPIWIPGGQVTMLAVPVAHRLAGGLVFALAVLLAVRVCGVAGTWRPVGDPAMARPS